MVRRPISNFNIALRQKPLHYTTLSNVMLCLDLFFSVKISSCINFRILLQYRKQRKEKAVKQHKTPGYISPDVKVDIIQIDHKERVLWNHKKKKKNYR